MLKKNSNINGIKINEIEYKVSQFADDTTLILEGSFQSLNESLNTLNRYALFSGLKVNKNKTHAVWIGSKNILWRNF